MKAEAFAASIQPADIPNPARISPAAFATGFFFSCRAALVMISVRWLRLGSEAGVLANFCLEALLLLLTALRATGPAPRSLRSLLRHSTALWVLAFLALSCSSLLWSAAISRPASFLYWCSTASDVIIVLLLLRCEDVRDVSSSLMRGFIVSTCVLACVVWIMPASDDLRLGDPDYFNTNQVGNLCAIAVFMAQFLAARREGNWKLPMFFLTLTLLRSLSKATIIAFLLAQSLVLVRDRWMLHKTKVAIAFSAVLLLGLYWGLIGSYIDSYTNTGNQAETLTGRTAIWAYTLDTALDKPWLGNGIDAMWKVFPPFGREMFEARHAENELLQQFFAYGLAGVVLLAGIYASLYRAILALPRSPSRLVLLALMLFIFIRGLAEAEPFDLLLPLWLILLIRCDVHASVAALRQPEPPPSPACAPVPALLLESPAL